jgi:hypothetical protein
MGKLTGIFAFLFVIWSSTHLAVAQQQVACDPALFKDYSTGFKTEEETFALIDIVDSSNFNSFKQDFSGNVTIPIYGVPVDFGASYSSFNQQRDNLHKLYQTNYNSRAAQAW